MRVNYHTHNARCKHACGIEEDYVKEAINKDLKILGMSDHGPYPFDRHGLRMDFSELSDYINTCKDLSAKYANKIKILTGIEIEFLDDEIDYYKSLFDIHNLEYLILGQHFFRDINGKIYNSFELNSTKDYIVYAKSIERAFETGLYAFLAHPDLVFINNFAFDDNCKEACDIIIQAAKKYDMILEFNANGLRRGLAKFVDGDRLPYPLTYFWKLVAKEKIKTVVSSDCHNPKQMYDEYVLKAYDMARELNLNLVYEIM